MAIIDVLLGVKVEIIVKRRALKEYEDPDVEEKERTATRYVEAVSEQIFEIKCSLLPNFEFKSNCITVNIYADGTFVDGGVIEKDDSCRIMTSYGHDPGDGQTRKYRFASLETVSDGKIKDSERAKAKGFGTITVKCVYEHATKTVKEKKKITGRDKSAFSPLGIVSEKALKGRSMTHSIDFADPPKKANAKPRKTTTITTVNSEPVPELANLAAKFVFCYRSKAALKSMLIIPRTPTPPPLEQREVGSLSADEIKELQKRLQEFKSHQEAQIKIKREQVEGEERPRKVAAPSQGDVLLQVNDEGDVREASTSGLAPRETIEID